MIYGCSSFQKSSPYPKKIELEGDKYFYQGEYLRKKEKYVEAKNNYMKAKKIYKLKLEMKKYYYTELKYAYLCLINGKNDDFKNALAHAFELNDYFKFKEKHKALALESRYFFKMGKIDKAAVTIKEVLSLKSLSRVEEFYYQSLYLRYLDYKILDKKLMDSIKNNSSYFLSNISNVKEEFSEMYLFSFKSYATYLLKSGNTVEANKYITVIKTIINRFELIHFSKDYFLLQISKYELLGNNEKETFFKNLKDFQ